MKNKIITGIVVIALLGGIVYILNKNKEQNEIDTQVAAQTNATVAVRVAQVKNDKANTVYTSNGNFIPENEVIIAAETPGRIAKLLVDEGSVVKAGQTLALVNGDQIQVQLQNAQTAYTTAQADATRFESAFQTGGVTQQQLDQVRLGLENAKAQLKSAQITAADAHVKAPINGIINKKFIEPGSFVSPGVQLFELVNVAQLKLRINVDESQVATLKLGDKIKVKASVYPNTDFEGTVHFIAPKADASLNFPVEMLIKNQEEAPLKAGMYGTAMFNAYGDNDATTLTVPREAFVGSVSSNQVFVVANDKAVLKTITTGRNFGNEVEVVEGLKEGDTVIVSGQINLIDQTPITIIK